MARRRVAEIDQPATALEGAASSAPPPETAKPYGLSPLRGRDRLIGWKVSIRRRGSAICRHFRADAHGDLDEAYRAALTVSVDAHWIAGIETGGQSKRRFFSVKRFGDDEARRLAIEQRRLWESGEEASPLGTLPGVFIRRPEYVRQDGTVAVTPYWTASFTTLDGRVLRRSFSVKRLGEEEARRMAIEQRRAWEREVEAHKR